MAAMLSNCSRFVPRTITRISISRTKVVRSLCSQGRILFIHTEHVVNKNSQLCTKYKKFHYRIDQPKHIHSTSTLWEIREVMVPAFAESVSEGDVRWEKKVGDQVKEDDVLCEIETDKTSVPVPAPGPGVLKEIFAKDGDTVKPGQKLCTIDIGATGGAAPAAEAPKPEAPAPPPTPAAAPPPPPPPPPPSQAAAPPPPAAAPPPPAARPPPPQAPKASMPVAAIKHAQSLEGAKVQLPPADYTREIIGTRTEQRVKMNRMRLRIAERLKDAQNTNAMLTTFNEIDMSRIMEFRKVHQESFTKKYGLKLGFMSPFIAASAYALKDQPVVNAVIDGTDIVYRDYVDISVAVATPKGLVVPVIRSVENKNFAEIEIALAAISDKARKGKISVEDMDGGTFTISNGGVFGSLMGMPIINPPQSAILGMHGVFDRPIALKGEVVIRPMMYVALTYDHRLIDGREAVMFLRKIKEAVEDPRIILAGL
ncbi:dihydrolipoyllysine-residue succinyltransferase component of 2-oxoglutarate dehydrogenase complex, mitochondrial isoform X1 [Hylaeus volcanicus]|uniref:dihydrolipoyllysine-residue succinyltransferase component of 2-oxoglutarate dehydrogenase complex, mitochondrial isoform X1 n=2 Tax=Hylaeus volcanicus TaxID=313075 RepID=UPI0023B77DDE|nr:dihydrolipoyllysine-residue succinyltransferase component of 2-oxoglutarate dehydrogenase complex, mitochondrial isoform X1 [Hylaeus volcanicus]XP_053985979.1 dihydrolipoyllysine-residue succinyltransferase component of 2-oxoglutarate dehydrogenase complex, mitochondrial isoform X1 [Hylaeus volcanicus]